VEAFYGINPLDTVKLCLEHENKRALQMVIESLNESLVFDLDREVIAKFINRKENVPAGSSDEENDENDSDDHEDDSEYDSWELDFSDLSGSECFLAIVREAGVEHLLIETSKYVALPEFQKYFLQFSKDTQDQVLRNQKMLGDA